MIQFCETAKVSDLNGEREGASLATSPKPGNNDSEPVSFFVRLTDNEFEPTIRSWRCPALDLPGSTVQDVYSRGSRIDKEKYRIIENQSYIRWVADGEPPEHIAAQVIVNAENLSNLEVDKDKAKKSEAWWKNFAVVVPIITALIAATASWLIANRSPSIDTKVIRENLGKIEVNITNASNSIPESCPGGKHGQTPDNGPRTIGLLNDARALVGQVREQVAKMP
ncbi:hypothetical protein FV218_10980 [Methylobacterium sp. WL69]|uniref:hypothetical protein n=1 Tax=Methylobacterium sp. WL69 TaxID=2603893 RepID=UPI0011CB86F2|nr:hypothetical protein [Methylobacterium sp. WL69]TXM73730.1 hypothetical protein FV218_10980 [Methylobacterium sp. WL69]